MCQLRKVTGATWGMTPETVLWLYTAIIRPYISYAAVVWWPRVNLRTVNNQFEHIQRLACLYSTGSMSTTPTAALEILFGLSPLPVYIRQEAMMACHFQPILLWPNGCMHQDATGYEGRPQPKGMC